MRLSLVIVAACVIAGPAFSADPLPTDVLVRRLIDGLKDPDPDVRLNLAVALAKVGPVAVEPLTAALDDSLAERRAGAAYALGQMGVVARPALPKLLDALDDKDLDVRRQASYSLSRLVPSGPVKPTAGGK
ncbi:MAG: HEAT repeat domain-containing protein [Fimbriiglobus sp.]|nr:HEAT repeat domain-containing protein [Fimbriiglobus sp.]